METHTKLTRPQSEEIFRQYFLTECYQGTQKMWHHKCGTLIRMHTASISLHKGPPESCPGPGVVSAGGETELQQVPYCARCEKVPHNEGCLHVSQGETIQSFEVDSTKAPPILVWRFADAPEEYRKPFLDGAKRSGGKAVYVEDDWLALVPPSFLSETGLPNWAESVFRGHTRRISPLPEGFLLVVGKSE